MKRIWFIALGVLILIALGAVGALYLFLRNEGSGVPPPLALSKVTSCSSPLPALAGSWEVRPNGLSVVGYRVTEKFVSLPAKTPAAGRTLLVAGRMTIAGGLVRSAVVRADLRGLSSNRGGRDHYLHAHAIQSNLYPMATFLLTSPLRLFPTPLPGKPVALAAPGRLTLHGVTHAVTFQLRAQRTCAGIEVVGRLPIKFADYRIVPPYVPGFAAVGNAGTIELKLEFHRQ
ncbi:MAG: YceI family protein [Chloroflexota bacterium]|nr:YceI family protein [Chloroflexota bacterium]